MLHQQYYHIILGYIDKDKEQIVGLQTDKPLKRAIMPNGGIKIVEKSCDAAGVKLTQLEPEHFKIELSLDKSLI